MQEVTGKTTLRFGMRGTKQINRPQRWILIAGMFDLNLGRPQPDAWFFIHISRMHNEKTLGKHISVSCKTTANSRSPSPLMCSISADSQIDGSQSPATRHCKAVGHVSISTRL